MALSPADRVRLGLDDGNLEEFTPPTVNAVAQTVRVPNLKLVLSPGDKATSPKLRHLVNELVACNLEEADYALKQMFAANPKLGLEAYVELLKFSLPQVKAVAVQVSDNTDSPRNLSIPQLLQQLAD